MCDPKAVPRGAASGVAAGDGHDRHAQADH